MYARMAALVRTPELEVIRTILEDSPWIWVGDGFVAAGEVRLPATDARTPQSPLRTNAPPAASISGAFTKVPSSPVRLSWIIQEQSRILSELFIHPSESWINRTPSQSRTDP